MLVRTATSTATFAPAFLDWTAMFGYKSALGPTGAVNFATTNSGSCMLVNGKAPEPLTAASAGDETRAAFFDGVLYNRSFLEPLMADWSVDASDATLVLRAYQRWGPDFLRYIRGVFALLVWDSESESLIAARDPLGVYPLFYAKGASGLMLSTSAYALAGRTGVSGAVNRAALADHLAHRWPDPEETFLVGVQRLPAGHRLDAGLSHATVSRYWDPAPAGKPVQWAREEELDRFDALLDTAVERCARHGGSHIQRSAIFLGGGFDSTSVAAVATDLARREAAADPVALSLTFRSEDCNEEEEQRRVAGALKLEHEILPFNEAVAPNGLLASALQLTTVWPAPLVNRWLPAYATLAERSARHGVSAILTGKGGSRWLSDSPYLSADVLDRLDPRGWWRFVRAWRRANRVPWARLIRGTVSIYGVRPLFGMLADGAYRGLQRRARVRNVIGATPKWVAHDRKLRRELRHRAHVALTPPRPGVGYYLRQAPSGVMAARMSMELEESFELGRRLGVRILHPYLDADLVDLLTRTPPHLLIRQGRSNGLVRETVARRFPGIGSGRAKDPSKFWATTMLADAGRMWEELGGAQALADLHIVDPAVAAKAVAAILAKPPGQLSERLWDLLTLETWVRTHA